MLTRTNVIIVIIFAVCMFATGAHAGERRGRSAAEDIGLRTEHAMQVGAVSVNNILSSIQCPGTMAKREDRTRIDADVQWRYEETTDTRGPVYYSPMSRRFNPSWTDADVSVEGEIDGRRSLTCEARDIEPESDSSSRRR